MLDVDNAIRFRQGNGFKATRAFVEAILVDRETYGNFDWGVPLSQAEASIIDGRRDIAESSRDAIRYAADQPSYAGMLFDREDRWMPVFWFAANLAVHREEIADRLPADVDFRVIAAELSMDELRQIQARITGDAMTLRNEGINVVTVGFDRRANSVRVGLGSPNDLAEAELRARYGLRVTTNVTGAIGHDACASRTNCGNRTGTPSSGRAA